MKKERDSRTRPRASALRTVLGARIVGSMAYKRWCHDPSNRGLCDEVVARERVFGADRKVGLVGIDRIEIPDDGSARSSKFRSGAGNKRVGSKSVAKARAVTIYGIKNCDTVKKARAWLDGRGVGLRLPRLQDP